jgi:two-component system OmpR family response regulator
MLQILVVDDTKNIRLLLTKCLEFEGYSVNTASEGSEALEQISKNKFDIIFLDVRMPKITGTDVLRRIREMGVSTPVIMITAFGNIKNALECTHLGAVAYLQKPFTENKIKQVLEEVLHFKPQRSSLDNILNLAEEEIRSNRFGDAELLLKNSLSNFFMEPRVYSLLSKAYEGMNKNIEAKRCTDIFSALQRK